MLGISGAIMEKQPVVLMIRPLEKRTLPPDATDQLLGWPVMTTRKLVHALTDRAALVPDYGMRRLIENTLDVLTEQILGRQI